MNPAHIVAVQDFSAGTLRRIVAHLQASTDFEHLVYREAELDAIWSITGFALAGNDSEREELLRLHQAAHQAHDLVAAKRPGEAAELLSRFL